MTSTRIYLCLVTVLLVLGLSLPVAAQSIVRDAYSGPDVRQTEFSEEFKEKKLGLVFLKRVCLRPMRNLLKSTVAGAKTMPIFAV